MTNAIQPFHLITIALAGWLNRRQQVVIDYLIEENRVLKDQLQGQRLRFTDEQRIRLAVKAKVLGRRGLDHYLTAMAGWLNRFAHHLTTFTLGTTGLSNKSIVCLNRSFLTNAAYAFWGSLRPDLAALLSETGHPAAVRLPLPKGERRNS